jgi:carboxymethylenebutenolidase
MQTQSFSIDVSGAHMPVYLARPDGDEPHPAVIVLQEIFGVNTEVKRIADLLASAGYVALAPNYYHRTHPDLNEPYTDEGLQNGFQAAGQTTKATLRADVSASAEWLNAQSYVKSGHIATWGFCFGGTVAFVTATLPELKGAIAFYGGSIAGDLPNGQGPGLADVQQIVAPMLLAFGGKDDYIPAEAIAKIDAAMIEAGKTHSITTYPDKGHAFFRDSKDAMNDPDVADAWNRVQTFLRETIG